MVNQVFMVIALFLSVPVQAFKTISQMQQAAQSFGQTGKSENAVLAFKDMLLQQLNERENNGYTGRYALKIMAYPGSRFIVWGPLKGAFQSLVRSLTFLRERGIIGEDLTLQQTDTYCVFLGDLCNEAEEDLEVLMAVLSLMNANPSAVFYVKGYKENLLPGDMVQFKRVLSGASLLRPLEKRLLNRTLSRFFSTLPLALYITGEDPQEGFIRLSYETSPTDLSCRGFTNRRVVGIAERCTFEKAVQPVPLLVKAILKAEHRIMSYKHYKGLLLDDPDKGATVWTAFSAPTEFYQKEYHFFYDAFSVITTADRLSDFRITLYNRDIRGVEPFSQSGTSILLTGQKVIDVKASSTALELPQLLKQVASLKERVASLADELIVYRRAVDSLPSTEDQ